jgi:hypothetical protein
VSSFQDNMVVMDTSIPYKSTTLKHIVIFIYPDTFDYIDWGSFPSELIVYISGLSDIQKFQNPNFQILTFLPIHEFYSLIDTSEFTMMRGDTTFAHMIQ